MIICPEKRLAFVHIYKTAGSAVTTVLAPYTDARFRAAEPRLDGHGFQATWHYRGDQHAPYAKHADDLREVIPDWDDFTVLAVVRNPYDWLVSIYRDFYRPKVWRDHGPKARFQRGYPEKTLSDLLAFLRTQGARDLPGVFRQVDFLRGVPNGRLKVVRFENLDTGLGKALSPLGIDAPPPPRINAKPGDADAIAAWRADPALIAYCNARFDGDFTTLGYEKA